MAYSDIQEKVNQVRMNTSVLLAEKYSQGNLFPKGSEGNPYSKNPRAQSAKRKRDYKKAQEEKKSAKQVSDEARQREWKSRKDRGEVFGDMPPDFNLIETGGKILDLLKFIPQMMIRGNRIAAAPYSLNPQRIMLPNGQMEYAPLNLRTDQQKENQHMMIYGGKWNKPIR